jgi:hypothetical protein
MGFWVWTQTHSNKTMQPSETTSTKHNKNQQATKPNMHHTTEHNYQTSTAMITHATKDDAVPSVVH